MLGAHLHLIDKLWEQGSRTWVKQIFVATNLLQARNSEVPFASIGLPSTSRFHSVYICVFFSFISHLWDIVKIYKYIMHII